MSEFIIKPGMYVRAMQLGRVCEVLAGPNARGEFQLAVGGMRVWAKASDLRPTEPSKKSTVPRRKRPEKPAKRSRAEIDLHGMTVEEARGEILSELNRALLDGCDELDIIHGLGSGKLRALTEELLLKETSVKRFCLLESNLGTTRAYL